MQPAVKGATAARVDSLPLDPPPFYLEREIRLPSSGLGISSVLPGLIILLGVRALLPGNITEIPSLFLLMVISLVVGSSYFAARFLAYWAVWLRVTRRHVPVNGIHPAARGELPRNGFLLVLLAPVCTVMPITWAALRGEAGFGPELWLAVAVMASISLRDLRAACRVLSIKSSYWIKETRFGLDVLKPVQEP